MSDEKSFEVGESLTVPFPENTRITFRDLFEVVEDGKVVASVDASFDFSDVDPRYQELLLRTIGSRGMQIMTMSPEAQAEADARWDEYKERLDEWRAFPWWKRLVTSYPVL